ncbi:hypothetical protein [Paraclostridium dentum]|uniref:hypothetical protein n=1 Tax=Paraclostridium dentum TaxID=2662455 RepID=UPI003F413E12
MLKSSLIQIIVTVIICLIAVYIFKVDFALSSFILGRICMSTSRLIDNLLKQEQ